MFPSFIGILDIQSWWEVPSIAYFCSLFRTAFNLLDFDIEELEEALLTDGTEDCASSLLTELIVRLLNGCLGNNDISAFNYQMFLRRLFRRKCQKTGRYNPFNTDIDFQFLPLRTKVEILYALCDFRLDAEDVFDLFKNLEAESLRVEPLGWDDKSSAYWYFYGTRLYREDIVKKQKNKKKKSKELKKKRSFCGDDWLGKDSNDRIWQVVCFTEADWAHLTDKFKKASSRVEKELYRSLSQNFLPEIPRLFQEKEKLQRKRLLELAPRRTSSRVLRKSKQKEDDTKVSEIEAKEPETIKLDILGREHRAKKRNLLRSQSVSSDSSRSSSVSKKMLLKTSSRQKSQEKKSKSCSATPKGEPPPEPPVKSGRKTNNSLASATGQIVISDTEEPVNSTRKKLKTSQIFGQNEEDIQTDMYKVLTLLLAHEDAWPFVDPVEEEYAPNYYAVIRRPMDLRKMEERLDSRYYSDFSVFKADFKLIVNNCRLYNGQDNEYTVMVDKLQAAFDRFTEKIIHRISSSDEEIAVEYQIPTPSRKHKLKCTESPSDHKRKKRKSQSNTDEFQNSSASDLAEEPKKESEESVESIESVEITKESHKHKGGKVKKKRKGHHRHNKHSKNHKKLSHSSSSHLKKTLRHLKKQKHLRENKKSKEKRKKGKHSHKVESLSKLKHASSQESLESSNRSRSASPLPSIHTPSPSPTPPDELNDPDFFKDKYDKIKERRRQAAKESWESLVEHKQKSHDKPKKNLSLPDKDKNQKLRETIEKLKAKNEKYKETIMFNNLFSSNSQDKTSVSSDEPPEASCSSKDVDEYAFTDDESDGNESQKGKSSKQTPKKVNSKKNAVAKNESASEALEQAVKDISKWLDDAPKVPIASSPANSPAQTISTDDHDNSRHEDDFLTNDKGVTGKKELPRKRPSSREPKILAKRREIQRTIERLQPGKSKGNLLTNATITQKVEEVTPLGPHNKSRENKNVLSSKVDEISPKLSLGSVLPAVGFSLGNDHNFTKTEVKTVKENKITKNEEESSISSNAKEDEDVKTVIKTVPEVPTVENDEKKEELVDKSTKFSQEKATPNLSAWFKAFGAPKSTTVVKKKSDEPEQEEKPNETIQSDVKPTSPKNTTKLDSPEEISPNAEGGDSPTPNVTTTPRPRRTSTGSSVSERSSFSQDLDSPRHQVALSSPLLRSPASPRTDDFQKITYPIINGTVRAGFYQDTTSIKSSPEKSCSPQEAPQSPFSPYSQHVYASNNASGTTAPNYFVDHNKSPLPTYGTIIPPPYYDSSRAPVISKLNRSHDDYTALGPDTSYQPPFSGSFAPAKSAYAHQDPNSSCANPQKSAETVIPNDPPSSVEAPEINNTLFPVKKRSYNDSESQLITNKEEVACKNIDENNKPKAVSHSKENFQKVSLSIHPVSSLPPASIDEIALALSEKSELTKENLTKDKSVVDFVDKQLLKLDTQPIDLNLKFNDGSIIEKATIDLENIPTDKLIEAAKAESIDMINMGYFNPDPERRCRGDPAEMGLSLTKNLQKTLNPCAKVYDIEAMAMNLGMTHQLKPAMGKSNMNKYGDDLSQNKNASVTNNDKVQNESTLGGIYNENNPGPSVIKAGSFTLADLERATKKLLICNTGIVNASTADYENWKLANQIRNPDTVATNYASNYSPDNNEVSKHKSNISVPNPNVNNYNKSLQQQQQLQNYSVARASLPRNHNSQHNLTSELRIPNPRGVIKNDLCQTVPISQNDLLSRTIDSNVKTHKQEKVIQNHPLVSTLQYKPPYSSHSSIPLETLRNIPNLPQMLERYSNEERYRSSFATSSSSLYQDKTLQMAQLYNKSVASDVHSVSTTSSIYSHPTAGTNDSMVYKPANLQMAQVEIKAKNKRKRMADSKQNQMVGNQVGNQIVANQIVANQIGNPPFHPTGSTSDVLTAVKAGIVPGSAFNFGPSTSMGLSGSLYADSAGFTMEDFRTPSTNQLLAANYMVAAVAHQRSTAESNVDKLVKPAHQNTTHTSASAFPFMGHSQVRAGYPFGGTDTSSPLYQQYLQRHQEELIRQTGAQIMSMYPQGYPGSLGVRQPYDSMNRHSWL